jgi:phage terminase large subunit-like protein
VQDLEKAQLGLDPEFPWRPDPAHANESCEFIELLPHTKGKWASKRETIRLEGFQCFIVCSLFGWLDPATEQYRFREAYICLPRKNAKSTLAAAVGIKKFAADNEYGAEIYSGATTKKQAWEVFRPARLMVKKTPELVKAFGIKIAKESLFIEDNESRFEPVIGKPGDGASPSCAIVDEYHEHATDELYDTMKTGMGARENPLLLVITTAGSDRSGPCYALQKELEKVLKGKLRKDRHFVLIYTIDDSDDWKSEKALIKANPNYNVSVFRDFLLDAQRDAIQSARKQNIFKTKHLNVWVNAAVTWMNMAAWDRCANPTLKIEQFLGEPCMIGLDLASKIDLASKVNIFRRIKTEPCPKCFPPGQPVQNDAAQEAKAGCERCHGAGKLSRLHYYAFAKNYLNEQAVENADCSHYAGWAHDGHLVITPGSNTDHKYIFRDIIADANRFQVLQIPHDPTQAMALMQFIKDDPEWDQGAELVEVKQNVVNFSDPMKEFEALVLDGRFHHDGDPVFGWAVANVICWRDYKDNIFPRKEKEENKIDPAVAAMMALKQWMPRPAELGSGVIEFW